jgi:hypothetical protein
MRNPVSALFGLAWIVCSGLSPQRGDAQAAAASGDAKESDPKAMEIVEKYIEAVGGREAFSAVQDRTVIFENSKFAANATTTAEIALYIKRAEKPSGTLKLREEWEVKGFQIQGKSLFFVQGWDGEKGWVQMLGETSPLEGRTLDVFLQGKYPDDPLLHFKEEGLRLSVKGKEKVAGEEALVVEAVAGKGVVPVSYFFSESTKLLLKREHNEPATPAGSSGKREELYKEYKSISFKDKDGKERTVRFPTQQEFLIGGQLDTDRRFTRIEFNTSLRDEIFRDPRAAK